MKHPKWLAPEVNPQTLLREMRNIQCWDGWSEDMDWEPSYSSKDLTAVLHKFAIDTKDRYKVIFWVRERDRERDQKRATR